MGTEQIKITKTVTDTSESFENGNKPLPITSMEAQNAVQMVTPGRISKILDTNGPLAIRFITQTLSGEIPFFKNLSTSKQRRLIMNVMETGYEEESIIFEKIGWGLWTIKRVEPMNFVQEREKTNKLNAKVRDNSNNPNLSDTKRKLSNGKKSSQVEKPAVPLSPRMRSQNSHSVVYIDENVLQTDEEDNDIFSEEDENDHSRVKNESEDFVHEMVKPNGTFSFSRRRKSSVVYDDSSPEALEQEILAQKIRPILKNRSRRSSSKGRASLNNNNIALNVKHADTSGIPPLPKLLYVPDDSNNLIRRSSVSGPTTETKSGRNSFSEDVSRRSSSRLSVSKESGIRSTLYHVLNDASAHESNNSNVSLGKSSLGIFQSLDTPMIEQRDQIIAAANTPVPMNNPTVLESPHSDTDEEDWANIGAESLRTMSDDKIKKENSAAVADDAARVLLSLK